MRGKWHTYMPSLLLGTYQAQDVDLEVPHAPAPEAAVFRRVLFLAELGQLPGLLVVCVCVCGNVNEPMVQSSIR
jgi:hypothetical protein